MEAKSYWEDKNILNKVKKAWEQKQKWDEDKAYNYLKEKVEELAKNIMKMAVMELLHGLKNIILHLIKNIMKLWKRLIKPLGKRVLVNYMKV